MVDNITLLIGNFGWSRETRVLLMTKSHIHLQGNMLTYLTYTIVITEHVQNLKLTSE